MSSRTAGAIDGFTLALTSVPDRDQLVVEIWRGDELFAELRRERSEVVVQLYPRRDAEPWDLPAAAVQNVLHAAQLRLGPRASEDS